MKYSNDPLFNWLILVIQDTFEFLVSDWNFQLKGFDANSRGCAVTYVAFRLEIQIWAEMGGRPECDLLIAGHRRSLNEVVAKRWPMEGLPLRPEYSGIEGEKKDFVNVLQRYATILRGHKDELLI